MRTTRLAVAALAGLMFCAPHLFAQDKPNPPAKTPPATLKINVVISETEGEKKVANLPYTFFLRAGDGGPGSWTKLRMGSRVPVATGSYQTGSSGGSSGTISPLVNTQFQYIDVGTNIDARVSTAEEGHYDLSLNLERSWVEGDVLLPGESQSSSPTSPAAHQFREPIVRQFKAELTLSMRDGQTIQSTQATDPVSGRVLTLTVTMNVVK